MIRRMETMLSLTTFPYTFISKSTIQQIITRF